MVSNLASSRTKHIGMYCCQSCVQHSAANDDIITLCLGLDTWPDTLTAFELQVHHAQAGSLLCCR